MNKVEQFDLIRREHFLHGKSIRYISKKYSVHRRLVRQALDSATPIVRKQFSKQGAKLLPSMQYLIDQWLILDQKAPVKQRHTARRIYARLIEECDFGGAEPTIRKYVGKRRRELFFPKKAFIIQLHLNGEEAEVDWYEAQVDFLSGRRKVYIFEMRACASGKEFHTAFLTQNQQAFLEAHASAFEYFGGVFKKIKYDNLGSAVKKVLQGRKREENERFMLLKSHYLFEAMFCIPGIQGAHEKGGVEGGAGHFRRNYLVPVPKADNIKTFNDFVKNCGELNNRRKISGRIKTIEEDWQEEYMHLLALPKNKFMTDQVRLLTVNDKSLVSVDNNYYSVFVKFVGRKVEVRIDSREINCFHEGVNIGSHIRLFGSHETSMKLDHYLNLLKYKPGALKGSLVFSQTKQRNEWPIAYEHLWQSLNKRLGEPKGTQMLIEILMLNREHGHETVLMAVEAGLQYGAYDTASILVIIRQQAVCQQPVLLENLGYLKRYNRPTQDLTEYNQLLS